MLSVEQCKLQFIAENAGADGSVIVGKLLEGKKDTRLALMPKHTNMLTWSALACGPNKSCTSQRCKMPARWRSSNYSRGHGSRCPEDKPAAPMPDMGGMGGMGSMGGMENRTTRTSVKFNDTGAAFCGHFSRVTSDRFIGKRGAVLENRD